MSDDFRGFDDRLRRIEGKRRALSNGFELQVQRDGLIVARPRRSRGLPISPRAVALFLVAFFGFKGLLIAALGPLAYDERLATLAAGSRAGKGGAWIMQAEPISRGIASHLAPYLN